MKTLRELAARLNAIIAENERRGHPEWNDLPVAVEIIRRGPSGRLLHSKFIPIESACSGTTGCKGITQTFVTMNAREENMFDAKSWPTPEGK